MPALHCRAAPVLTYIFRSVAVCSPRAAVAFCLRFHDDENIQETCRVTQLNNYVYNTERATATAKRLVAGRMACGAHVLLSLLWWHIRVG